MRLLPMAQAANNLVLIALIIFGVVLLVIFVFIASFFSVWLQAFMARANIGFFELVGMKFRKVDTRQVILARIHLVQAGINVPTEELEKHFLSGGRVTLTSRVVVEAKKLNIPLDWPTAALLDLKGKEYLLAMLPEDHRPAS